MYRAAQPTNSSPCGCLSKPPYFARLNSCFGRVYAFFFLSKTATLSALFPAGLFCFVVVVDVVVFQPNATQKIEVDKTTETSEQIFAEKKTQ